MLEARFKQVVLRRIVVREEQESFALRVKSSHWIDVPRKRSEIAKRCSACSISELRENAVRLVEENVAGFTLSHAQLR